MKRKFPSWFNVLLATVFGLTIALSFSSLKTNAYLVPHAHEQAAISQKQFQTAYGKLPMSFEANLGQVDAQVKFLAKGSGVSLFLTPIEAVLALSQQEQKPFNHSHQDVLKPQPAAKTSTSVVRMQLKGANPQPQMTGLEPLPGKVNYFLGNDPKQWHSNIPTYAKVQYQQVYPGVDMVYYGNQQQLEYDFVLAPGADPKTIKLAFQGADKLEVDSGGDLVLHTTGGQIKLHKPLVYQQVNGVKQAVRGGYQLQDKQLLSFEVGSYDATKQLIIDPVLSYSTYLGGNGNLSGDRGNGIAVDRWGNAYVTGFAGSSDFPTQNPFQNFGNFFVTKLNSTGTALVYSTYLGNGGNFFADIGGIAVDREGNAYVTGTASGPGFPTQNPFQSAYGGGGFCSARRYCSDAFVTKLNATGSTLVYSTYLGGSYEDNGYGIAVDKKGNAYVTGYTFSTDFPTKNPFQAGLQNSPDAFVTKLDATGSALVYSTYLGGRNTDYGSSIAVDKKGNAYITGQTLSSNDIPFPLQNPFQAASNGFSDAFVTKLDATGSALVYSTYLGGSDAETGSGIVVDRWGNAYVTGYTTSSDFPTQNPFQAANGGGSDAFVTKLDQTGSALVYSTYLGGSSGATNAQQEGGSSIAVGRGGNAYIVGTTYSSDFPTQNPFQATLVGPSDAFVTKLEPTGTALVYSTYLGGSNIDIGKGITVDRSGDAYVTGNTNSSDFPTQNPFQAANGYNGPYGFPNAFVTKLTQ